ncbi:MAG: undecaprenyl/decaprenyl-phosphate alpha-N-acetylglucosaminyl 1-phosphate transferase, partial [Acidobacteriota bacterium]|nr:undecaprenyl/decaprenyl-phosphate alpha-N-acetylglucosaminyl 1-phosphate transferase [Acidobacteriota bacterium]
MTSVFYVRAAEISGAAMLLAIALTPMVRYLARRIGAVAAPKADRWHDKPTAMMGGVAIFLAVSATLLL